MTDFIVKQQLKNILGIVKNQLPNEVVTAYTLIVHANLEKVFINVNGHQYEIPGEGSMIKEGILTLGKMYSGAGDLKGCEISYDETTKKCTGNFYLIVDGQKQTKNITI